MYMQFQICSLVQSHPHTRYLHDGKLLTESIPWQKVNTNLLILNRLWYEPCWFISVAFKGRCLATWSACPNVSILWPLLGRPFGSCLAYMAGLTWQWGRALCYCAHQFLWTCRPQLSVPAYLSVDPAVSMDYRPQLYAFLSVDPKGGRGCPSSPLSAVSGQCSARSLASQSQDFVFCLFLLLAHSPDLKKDVFGFFCSPALVFTTWIGKVDNSSIWLHVPRFIVIHKGNIEWTIFLKRTLSIKLLYM